VANVKRSQETTGVQLITLAGLVPTTGNHGGLVIEWTCASVLYPLSMTTPMTTTMTTKTTATTTMEKTAMTQRQMLISARRVFVATDRNGPQEVYGIVRQGIVLTVSVRQLAMRTVNVEHTTSQLKVMLGSAVYSNRATRAMATDLMHA